MKKADQVLEDEALLDLVYEALRRRLRRTRTRGRNQTPAGVVLRLMLLKRVRNWSYEKLEREVRANVVYRLFTRLGTEKVPDGCEDHGTVGAGAGSGSARRDTA